MSESDHCHAAAVSFGPPPPAVEAPEPDFEARIEDGNGASKAGDEVDFAKLPVAEAFKILDVGTWAAMQGVWEARQQLCA